MKICYLGDGNSIHTKRWLNAFIKRGHNVHLIMNDASKVKGLQGVSLHSLDLMGLNKFNNSKYLSTI